MYELKKSSVDCLSCLPYLTQRRCRGLRIHWWYDYVDFFLASLQQKFVKYKKYFNGSFGFIFHWNQKYDYLNLKWKINSQNNYLNLHILLFINKWLNECEKIECQNLLLLQERKFTERTLLLYYIWKYFECYLITIKLTGNGLNDWLACAFHIHLQLTDDQPLKNNNNSYSIKDSVWKF